MSMSQDAVLTRLPVGLAPGTDQTPGRGQVLVLVWTVVLLAINVLAHPTPLYFVETDLVGEYIPAARQLLAGFVDLDRYVYKGPGYPAILALMSLLCGGNFEIAARVLSPLASGCAAWIGFLLARRLLGPPAGLAVLLGMLFAPIHVRYAIEAGTDAPALCLMLGSTWLVVSGSSLRASFLAGLLAAAAILMRTNAAFLVPCAVLVLASRARGGRSILAYVAGLAAPLAVWWAVALRAGGLPRDRNYLNVAWELYGRGVSWERFELTTGARFHSMTEVLLHDPARAILRLVQNLATHRLEDLRALGSPWLAILVVPGLGLMTRNREARIWLVHAGACAVILAMVFYNARFSLYLMPIYLAAAGVSLSMAHEWLSRTAAWRGLPRSAGALVVPVLGGCMLLALARTSLVENRDRLRDAPHEARLAGAELSRLRLAGKTVLARKPHVAHYAGMNFAPIPLDQPLWQLPHWALFQGIEYLFYSGLERNQRPELGILADSGVVLPGFEPVMSASLPEGHSYAVYRFVSVRTDSIHFAAAYRKALRRYEARHGDSPEALLFLAVQYVALGDPSAALGLLDRLIAAGAADAGVERIRAQAYEAMGNLPAAVHALERCMQFEPATGWHWVSLGRVRARMGDATAARACFERAVAVEPANAEYLKLLGRAQVETRDPAAAAATFERALRLAPHDLEARRFAMGAWQLAGNTRRMEELYAEGIRAGLEARALAGNISSAE